MSKPDIPPVFWVVIAQRDIRYYRHDTEESATKEARRLKGDHGGAFRVMGVLGTAFGACEVCGREKPTRYKCSNCLEGRIDSLLKKMEQDIQRIKWDGIYRLEYTMSEIFPDHYCPIPF